MISYFNIKLESESHDGPMHLLEVVRVRAKRQMNYTIFEIVFKNGIILAATQYHAFSCLRDGDKLYLPPQLLSKHDLIWVDVSAFVADGSIFVGTKHKRTLREALNERY